MFKKVLNLDYTTIARIQGEEFDTDEKYKIVNPKTLMASFPNGSFPARSSFYYDLEANEDDLSSSTYSSRPQSSFYQEYLQNNHNDGLVLDVEDIAFESGNRTTYNSSFRQNFANSSIASVIRF